MKQDDLLKLIDRVDESSLAYFSYKNEDVELTLAKEVPAVKEQVQQPAVIVPSASEQFVQQEHVGTKGPADVIGPAHDLPEEISQSLSQAEGEIVESPMVGVVYLQPQPDADPYVKVGDYVNEGQTLLIIEAMKLMNEIQAPKSGIVTEILVNNEEVVEYGQDLVRIK